MRNNNQAIIRKLVNRSLKANKKRSVVITAAIVLTTFMITAVFSVTLGLVDAMQTNFMRMEGSRSHAMFGAPSAKQLERLQELDYIDIFGTGHYIGLVENIDVPKDVQFSLVHLSEKFFDHMLTPAITDIVGNLPVAENEIMISRWALEQMGIENPEVGMPISLSFAEVEEDMDLTNLIEETFILSGFFTSFDHFIRGEAYLIASESYAQQMGKSVHDFHGSVNIIFKKTSQIHQDAQRLIEDLALTGLIEDSALIDEQEQGLLLHPVFNRTRAERAKMAGTVALLVTIFMLTGALLIYNVLYTSIARDIRFYGLLKGIGTTSKQIRLLVIKQVIKMCLLGIPLGLLLGTLASYAIAPYMTFHSGSGAVNITSSATVSFSPFIYLGACLVTLVTSAIGASAPAKRAALISPVEAMKYIGEIQVKNYNKARIYGKLPRMALRNIFRDYKRTRIVLLSLVLGMTMFISATLVTSSIDIDQSVRSVMGNHDFRVEDMDSWNEGSRLDDEFLEQLGTLSTIEEVQTDAHSPIVFSYQSAFDEYIEEQFNNLEQYGFTKDVIREFLLGHIYHISGEEISQLNDTLDIEAFERGEFAVIPTNQPELYENLEQIEIEGLVVNGYNYERTGNSFTIPIGGFIDSTGRFRSYRGYGSELAILVSDSFFEQWRQTEPQFIFNLYIRAKQNKEAEALADLEGLFRSHSDIMLLSRAQLQQETEEAKMILFLLGGGISLILGSVGLMNFINSISMGIIVRKRELATLESIGMTQKQLKKMLTFEGLWFGVITLLLVAVLGNGIALSIYLLISNGTSWGDVMVFRYPTIPTCTIAFIILIICIITPSIVYRLESKATIVEKLREIE